MDQNWKKSKIAKKYFLFFSLVGKILTIYFTQFYTAVCGQVKMAKNDFFLDFDFFYLGGWGIDMTLGKGSFDPKRHPKSLVSISLMSGGKYSNVRVSEFCCCFREIFRGPKNNMYNHVRACATCFKHVRT